LRLVSCGARYQQHVSHEKSLVHSRD
jgi:hypothetical protein